jgi:predicted Zn-dependent protease with MMP-like domain
MKVNGLCQAAPARARQNATLRSFFTCRCGWGISIRAQACHIAVMTDAIPSLDEMEQMARRVVEGLPAPFRAPALAVAICVVDWPEQEMLDELEIDDPLDLTGLYDGIPMTEKSVFDQPMGPDTVWLFREPILDEWRARGDVTIEELVAHVTVHEFAHHFGWSDDDIAVVDPWWE